VPFCFRRFAGLASLAASAHSSLYAVAQGAEAMDDETEKNIIQSLAREVADLIPALHRDGSLGSAREYAKFYERIVVGFVDLLMTDRTRLSQTEWILLREIADSPMIGALNASECIDLMVCRPDLALDSG
jgi:hypothetical protein